MTTHKFIRAFKLTLLVSAVITLASCDKDAGQSNLAAESESSATIALVVPVTIDAFTRFEEEFRRVSEASGAQVVAFSAEGDATKFDVIVRRALRDDPDLLVTVGTQLTNVAFGPQFAGELPIVVASCISGPSKVESLVSIGLEPPRSAPVAIISDNPKVDIYRQSANLLTDMLGADATVGVLFTPGEINSENTGGLLIEAVEARGMTALRGALTGPADVAPVTESLLIRGADVVVIPHDKAATTEAAAVVKLALEAPGGPVPVFALDDGTVRTHGAAVAVSVSYGNLGALTAEQALAILAGEDPSTMPIVQQERADLYASRESLGILGIEEDAAFLASAVIYE